MNQLPAYIQNRTTRRQVASHVNDGLSTGSMPAVSIKGNQFTLVDSSGNEKPIETRWLDCIIIDTNPGVSRTFWGLDSKGQPAGYSEGNVGPPVCFSDNGIGASTRATEPQSTNCRSCKMSQFNWPSRVDPTKSTTACRPTKKAAVWAFTKGTTEQDGIYRGAMVVGGSQEPIAFALRIPVTSHENLGKYCKNFLNQPFDVSDVVTRIEFVHGQVGLLKFTAIGIIEQELNAEIDKTIAKKVTDDLVGRGDQPIQALPAPGLNRFTPEQRTVTPSARQLQSAEAAMPPPFTKTQPEGPAEPKKRVRRTKAEMEAARQSQAASTATSAMPSMPAAAPQQSPFTNVARVGDQVQPNAPVAPFARAQNGPVPNHGIVANAPEPTEDMSATLEDLFKLPT